MEEVNKELNENTVEYIPGTTLPTEMPRMFRIYWVSNPTKQQFCDKIEFWNFIYEQTDFDASAKDRSTVWEYWKKAFGK